MSDRAILLQQVLAWSNSLLAVRSLDQFAARLAQYQNTRAAGLFEVQIRAAENGAAQIEWKKIEKWRAWAQLSEGSYMLRTNVTGWSDEDLWRAYIQF